MRKCYATLKSNSQLICIQEWEKGYYPVRVQGEHVFGDEAKSLRDTLNEKAGIDWPTRMAFETGSMFGWDVPGANPDTYKDIPENLRD